MRNAEKLDSCLFDSAKCSQYILECEIVQGTSKRKKNILQPVEFYDSGNATIQLQVVTLYILNYYVAD